MDTDVDCPDSATVERPEGADEPAAAKVKEKKRGGGPKTPEGKRRSSANSTKWGFRSKVLMPAEIVGAFERHKAGLMKDFQPQTDYRLFLVAEMALTMAQLERCATLTLADIQDCVDSACFDWCDERMTAAEKLGKRLPTDPSWVAHALEQTVQGIDWKILRWQGFSMAIGIPNQEKCSDELRLLAFDLMGVPLELRSVEFKVPAATNIPALQALARSELARLEGAKEKLVAPRDESRRELAMKAMPVEEHPKTTQLRRWKASLTKYLKWTEDRLHESCGPAASAAEQPGDRGETTPPAARREAAPNAPERPRGDDSFKQGPLSPAAVIEYQLQRLEANDREVLAQWRADRAKAAAQAPKAAEGAVATPKPPPPAPVKPAEGTVTSPKPAAQAPVKPAEGAVATPKPPPPAPVKPAEGTVTSPKPAAQAPVKPAEGAVATPKPPTPAPIKPAEGTATSPKPAAQAPVKPAGYGAGPAVAVVRGEASAQPTAPLTAAGPAASGTPSIVPHGSGALAPACTSAQQVAAPLNRFQQADEKRRARKTFVQYRKAARRAARDE